MPRHHKFADVQCHKRAYISVLATICIAQKTAHYDDVIMTMLASQITSLTVVYSIVYSGVNQRKHQSSASLAFVREIHRGPVNFPHKWPATRKMFPFDDVIMCSWQDIREQLWPAKNYDILFSKMVPDMLYKFTYKHVYMNCNRYYTYLS